MVTDQKVRKLMKLNKIEKASSVASAKSGMPSENRARKLPSQY